MALTRAFLKSMSLTEEQVAGIIEAHTETVDALKKERDTYKASAETLEGVQKELDDLKAKGDGGWQKKYEDEHTAFEAYKNDQQKKASYASKENAFKALLKEVGVSEQIEHLALKASREQIEAIELDAAGTIKDKAALTDSIKTDYAAYIKTEGTSGADTRTPPGNEGGSTFDKMSLADKMAYANDHPDAPEVKAWLG